MGREQCATSAVVRAALWVCGRQGLGPPTTRNSSQAVASPPFPGSPRGFAPQWGCVRVRGEKRPEAGGAAGMAALALGRLFPHV